MLAMKAALAVAALGVLFTPANASAATYHWANGNIYLNNNGSARDPYSLLIWGVYCHEMDANNVRNIHVNATWPSGALYGTWVSFQTAGYRSYAANNKLSGACRNPHSVGYWINAHDNYNPTIPA